MRFALVLILFSLLLTACSRRARITGTWHDKPGTFAFVFNPDGSFSSGADTNQSTGTWRIDGEMLTLTLTNANYPSPGGKVGDTVQFRIIRVDSHNLVLRLGGQTASYSR